MTMNAVEISAFGAPSVLQLGERPMPVAGAGVVDGVAWQAGECLTLTGRCEIAAEVGSDLLLAYPGETRI